MYFRERSSIGRASASKVEGCGFKSCRSRSSAFFISCISFLKMSCLEIKKVSWISFSQSIKGLVSFVVVVAVCAVFFAIIDFFSFKFVSFVLDF